MAEKTWAQLESDLADTFRKWRVWDYTLISPFGAMKAVERRKALRAGLTLEQRRVEISFIWRNPDTRRTQCLRVIAEKRDDPTDNLDALAKGLETLRMAEVRGVQHVVTVLNRQMYLEPTATGSAATTAAAEATAIERPVCRATSGE